MRSSSWESQSLALQTLVSIMAHGENLALGHCVRLWMTLVVPPLADLVESSRSTLTVEAGSLVVLAAEQLGETGYGEAVALMAETLLPHLLRAVIVTKVRRARDGCAL